MISVFLDTHQTRSVALQHIANNLITMKQYLERPQINHYKFMINEFASLTEMEQIRDKFDKAWPSDVKWDC